MRIPRAMILEPGLKLGCETEKPLFFPLPLPASPEGLGTEMQAPGSREKPPLTGPQSPGPGQRKAWWPEHDHSELSEGAA